MSQFTVTYRTAAGARRFAFIDAGSVTDAQGQIARTFPGSKLLTARENDPPLPVIEAVDNYTDYTYQVQVRIDSDSGAMTVFIFGQESGEIGKPINGGSDLDIAHSVGRMLIEESRRSEHGWGPNETLDDHQ